MTFSSHFVRLFRPINVLAGPCCNITNEWFSTGLSNYFHESLLTIYEVIWGISNDVKLYRRTNQRENIFIPYSKWIYNIHCTFYQIQHSILKNIFSNIQLPFLPLLQCYYFLFALKLPTDHIYEITMIKRQEKVKPKPIVQKVLLEKTL